MATTLRDIAGKAGVSVSTASRVLRHDASFAVSDETRREIWQIASNLGYRAREKGDDPRPGAGARQQARRIVYILPAFAQEKFKDPIISEIIGGIETEVVEQGYYLGPCHNIAEYERSEILHRIAEQRPDGAIFLGHVPQRLFQVVCNLIPHHVTLFSDQDEESLTCITADFERYGYRAVKYLIDNGHRKIAFIGGGDDVSPEDNRQGVFYKREGRFMGYVEALFDHGIELNSILVKDGDWQIEQAYAKTKELLSRETGVTAIFAATDRMSIGVMRAVDEVGLRIPADISLVGFDNIYSSGFFNPPITTVDYDKDFMGKFAVRCLVNRIRGNVEMPTKTVLPCRMVIRQSVRKLTGESARPAGAE